MTRRFDAVTAIDDLDLEVPQGQVLALLGHNGAGKTTVVRLCAGLLAADAGQVTVLGRDPATEGASVRQSLGVLPARPVVDDRLTATQNLRFAAAVFGVEEDLAQERAVALLERFELSDRAEERVGGYSTGMRQRLSLARVLLTDPRLLLLDEPTAALDPVAARLVRSVLSEIAAEGGRTVLVCTHDLAEAEALCDRVIVLAEGRSIADGSPRELAATHGRGTVDLEVGAGQAPAAAERLRERGEDVEVVGGDRLRLPHLAPERTPEVVRLLVAARVDLHDLHRATPSLEEVYLALHGAVPEDRDPEEER